MGPKGAELLDGFEHGRIPLLEFMRRVAVLRDAEGLPADPALGTVVVGSFGRHTEGRDLMSCILEIEGFKVQKAERDATLERMVGMCADPSVTAMCISVQSTYECPDLYRLPDLIAEAGLSERIVVNIGGAAVTRAEADKMGSDVYGSTAIESVRLTKTAVLSEKRTYYHK
jgi:methanogenic corrinoid protein MtbC1